MRIYAYFVYMSRKAVKHCAKCHHISVKHSKVQVLIWTKYK